MFGLILTYVLSIPLYPYRNRKNVIVKKYFHRPSGKINEEDRTQEGKDDVIAQNNRIDVVKLDIDVPAIVEMCTNFLDSEEKSQLD